MLWPPHLDYARPNGPSKRGEHSAGPALAWLSPACGGSKIATDSTRILGMTQRFHLWIFFTLRQHLRA